MILNPVKLLLVSTLFLSFVIVSCKKEKPELLIPETSPCELDKPADASFWIGQSVDLQRFHNPCASNGSIDTIIPRDYAHFNQGGFLYFTTYTDCFDEVEWIIGTDPTHRYGKQIYVQFFSNDVKGSTIPITCIVRKTPNLLCYPDDDGVDTIVRNVYFDTAAPNHSGHFLGHNQDESPSDTFEVWIKPPTFSPYIAPPNEDIVGLPKGCHYSCGDYPFIERIAGVHRLSMFCGDASVDGTFWDCPNSGTCPHVKGIIEYSADYDTVKITYNYAGNPSLPNDGANSVHKVFIGIRQ